MIGLLPVDSKIPNLALMKLSAWHKKQGDDTELLFPMKRYEKVYASKIFTFSPMPDYYIQADEVEWGGSAISLQKKLPEEIENIYPDYALYPDMGYAMGFISRGCVRNCEFCIVREKEGLIHQVAELKDFWHGQKKIMLLDPNLSALSNRNEIIKSVIDSKAKIDFSQGLDVRLMTDDFAELLSKVKLWKQLRFAWDLIDQEKQVKKGLEIVLKHIKAYRVMVYVLIGYNTTPEEDLYRVMYLRGLGVDPYAMAYYSKEERELKKTGVRDEPSIRYKMDFSRWVNKQQLIKSVKWADYKGRKI